MTLLGVTVSSDKYREVTRASAYCRGGQVRDHRTGKNRFEQDGDEMVCTYDEAASICREYNKTRKKGRKLTVLPLVCPCSHPFIYTCNCNLVEC